MKGTSFKQIAIRRWFLVFSVLFFLGVAGAGTGAFFLSMRMSGLDQINGAVIPINGITETNKAHINTLVIELSKFKV